MRPRWPVHQTRPKHLAFSSAAPHRDYRRCKRATYGGRGGPGCRSLGFPGRKAIPLTGRGSRPAVGFGSALVRGGRWFCGADKCRHLMRPGNTRVWAVKSVASSNADLAVGWCDVGPAVGWPLAEGPVRPVGVVVTDVLAEGLVKMSSAGDEDAVGALAPGWPSTARGSRSGAAPDRRCDVPRCAVPKLAHRS